MKPALSAEEWGDAVPGHGLSSELAAILLASGRAHEVAALCLHGQDYGFTREMARALRRCVMVASEHPNADQAVCNVAHGGIDRIEALLPPEGT